MATKIIDNFRGSMTVYVNGDSNSGNSNVFETFAQNPFIKPGDLTWNVQPTQIDAAGAVITDLIMDAKERVESGVLYVYAIGHTGRVYKIQVNDPTSHTPDFDSPVLLTTVTIGSPTFTKGGFIEFFGNTEQIYIGHDKGTTKLNFDGTGEAAIAGTWTQSVPRPLKVFVSVTTGQGLYVGNGPQLAVIGPTGTVTSSSILTFINNTEVRDLDVSPDGNYLEVVVSRLPQFDITSATQQTTSTANQGSYIFKWNGTDTTYTSYTTFPTFSLGANIMFQDFQYTFGYDQNGSAIFNPTKKILTEPELNSPLPNAIVSTGNIVSWMTPLYFQGNMYLLNNIYGQLDREVLTSYHSILTQAATAPETDIIRIPCQIVVSNFGLGPASNGYTNGTFGTSKVYYSTLETSSAPTTKYRFYSWQQRPSPQIPTTGTPILGVYQTQTELYSKKVKMGEVRIYGEPWVANNAFQIDFIGSDGNPISGATGTFVAGTNLTIGSDYAWYTSKSAPTYAIAARVTNLGTTNHVISKIEYDYNEGGK